MFTSRVAQNFLIFSIVISFARSELYKVFDESDINSTCDFDTGVYKLESDCAFKGLRKAGILRGYNEGDVVCCKDISTEKTDSTSEPESTSRSNAFLHQCDLSVLETPCESEHGSTHKFAKDCKVRKGLECFVLPKTPGDAEGPVVCCPKSSPGDASRAHCNEESWKNLGDMSVNILGGTSANVGQFPSMVAIFLNQSFERENLICGGSLISDKYILTAAHCFKRQRHLNESSYFVRLGRTSIDLHDTEDGGIPVDRTISLKNIVKHPSYKSYQKYHDIALIKLDEPVTFTNAIKPICLQVDKNAHGNKNLIVTGFGISDVENKNISDWLMYADNIYDYGTQKCQQNLLRDSGLTYKMPKGVIDGQLCAMGRADDTGKTSDTCQGDSGGPLIYENFQTKKNYLVGLTSFGLTCGSEFTPSVYTRVSNYIEWIENIVWP